MLSVILYGRNDSHGYNLHKRAALSLNAIAEVLTGADDEIIFVDYNTPDELPTFPEAIADTLTDRAKGLLRILRVRPWFHQQYAGRTKLVALESQSRNIAVRRANPANRWVLSTNTDMIFCPRKGHASLTEAIAALEDGFYHLPRFEVPEGFWERLDRADPKAAIAAMEAHGVRFHINEIVYGAYDNLYEAPGDFQLFLRQDLYEIHGFDERMILGWHVDSNVARRMKLLRGEVKTAVDDVWGYHTGHTRQATSLHGGDRTENDFNLFVGGIDTPGIPSQADTWGAPDAPIEEVRLTTADPYFAALSQAVGSEGPDIGEATYNGSSFGKVSYDPQHVLPHLCDLMFNLPPGRAILYFGADLTLLTGLATFLRQSGREPRFLIPDIPGLIGDGGAYAGLGEVIPLPQAVAEADMVILQYPSADMTDQAARRRQEWLCQRMLFTLSAVDPSRAEPRRVTVINGIHNGLTQPLDYLLSPTVMPFSTRIRQGFMRDTANAAAAGGLAERPIYERLNRRLPFSPTDRALLRAVVDGLRAGAPPEGWRRLAPEIAAIASAPSRARAAFGLSDADAGRLAAQAADAMGAELGHLAEPPVVVGPRPQLGNRLLSGSDWDSPDWLRIAAAFFNLDALDFRGRTRWMWEHVSLADAIGRALPTDPLAGGPAPKVMFLSEHPDPLAAVLAHIGYEVRFATATDILGGQTPGDWSHVLEETSLTFPDTWKPYRPEEGLIFDAFVSPLPCLFEREVDEVDALLERLHGAMAPGALFLATAPVQINEIAYGGALGLAEWKVLYEPQGPLGVRGFTPVGGMDDRIPLDTALRFAFQNDPQQTIHGLSYGFYASRMTSALLTAAWPRTLAKGAAERIAWTPRMDGGWTVEVPYLSAGAAQLKVRRSAPQGQRGGLSVAAEKVLDDPAIVLDAIPRNVLPFAVTRCEGERTPVSITLQAQAEGEDLGPWLALSFDAGDAKRLVVDFAGGGPISDVASIIHGLGQGPVEINEGQVVVLPREDRMGRIGLAVRFEGAAAQLTGVTAYIEAT